MDRAQFKGLKGAAISILWIVEKTERPFRKSDFFRLFSDKTIAAAFDDLLHLGIFDENDGVYSVTEAYRKEVGVIPTPTTTTYINNIVSFKDIKSSRSEKFRQDVYDFLSTAGIGEPLRTNRSNDCTLEYVEWLWDDCKKQGKNGRMFAHRLNVLDPMPEGKAACPHCGVTLIDGECYNAGCEQEQQD